MRYIRNSVNKDDKDEAKIASISEEKEIYKWRINVMELYHDQNRHTIHLFAFSSFLWNIELELVLSFALFGCFLCGSMPRMNGVITVTTIDDDREWIL